MELIRKFSALVKFNEYCLFCEYLKNSRKNSVCQWKTMHFLGHTFWGYLILTPWALFDSNMKLFVSIDNKYILSYGGSFLSMVKASFCLFEKFISPVLYINLSFFDFFFEWVITSAWYLHYELTKIFDIVIYVWRFVILSLFKLSF